MWICMITIVTDLDRKMQSSTPFFEIMGMYDVYDELQVILCVVFLSFVVCDFCAVLLYDCW